MHATEGLWGSLEESDYGESKCEFPSISPTHFPPFTVLPHLSFHHNPCSRGYSQLKIGYK